MPRGYDEDRKSRGTPGEGENRAAPLDLVIAGIPRSGTSYLCNLLHRFDNCVILNEPPEIAGALSGATQPGPLVEFYRQTRQDVAAGKPIRNKLADGKVTEDTSRGNEFSFYTPRVGADFVLGVKATIAFLSRLAALRRAMPGARVVACVRNPFDTIASWKRSFEHLRVADLRGRPIGHPADPWLSGVRRAELEQIDAITDLPTRRAAWWAYLAELVLESADELVLVRYEEMVRNPWPILAAILRGGKAGEAGEEIAPSEWRGMPQSLEAADVQAIRALCSDAAARLGVYRAEA